MQVFKLCLKIVKKHLPALLIYVIIFTVMAVIMSANMTSEQEKTFFASSKVNLAFLAAEDTPLVRGLKAELAKRANFVDLPDQKEALQDALFFRKVSYILRVPAGFSESFMQGAQVQLEKTTVPASYNNAYLDLCIEQYLHTARLYVEQLKNISQAELVQHLQADLNTSAAVVLQTDEKHASKQVFAHYFFNYLAYSLMAILILGMSSLMLVFNDKNLRQRNACSPLSMASFNRQLAFFVLVFACCTWAVMVIICFFFSYRHGLNLNALYFLLNSFVFAVCMASLSYLIGLLVKNDNTIPAVSNVLTLGLSFISGVFVPAEFLGDTVLKMASFTPTYWYVAANNHIAALAQFNFATLKPVFNSIFIQLGFALAFLIIALTIGKKRRWE